PNLLLQKLPGPELKATVKLDFNSLEDNEQFGLIIMGTDYSYLGIKKSDDIFYLLQVICIDADKNGKENEVRKEIIQNNTMYLSVKVEETAIASFCYSIDGESFKSFGETFNIKPGKWIGAKVGVFCISEEFNENSGFVENDWFRIEL
ncbi:MAG: glycoside hydrolase, partial [Bacteroidales bacterium]|nr:glycoside hydrolase [Bacteroidales bacterium]